MAISKLLLRYPLQDVGYIPGNHTTFELLRNYLNFLFQFSRGSFNLNLACSHVSQNENWEAIKLTA